MVITPFVEPEFTVGPLVPPGAPVFTVTPVLPGVFPVPMAEGPLVEVPGAPEDTPLFRLLELLPV